MDIVNILVDMWMDISWFKANTRFEKHQSLEDNADIHGSVHYNGEIHWVGLRENLQETMVFTIKYRAFL